jgi:hypothetical protein
VVPRPLDFGDLFVLTETIIRVEFAVERLGVVNGARIEFALSVFAQERATSGSEKATQIVGVARVNR